MCFTVFDMTKNMEELAKEFTYMAYGEETCSNGRPHFQCFAYNQQIQRFSWWKARLEPNHFEFCKGNLQENEAYCKKQGVYHEFGVKPMGDGKKRSLMNIKTRLEDGERLFKIQKEDDNFETVVRYERGLKNYVHALRMESMNEEGFVKKQVHVIVGPAGTHKTKCIYDRHGYHDVYRMPLNNGRWFGNYDGQPVVLFDDVDPKNFMSIGLFLQITDGYPMEVEVKGGFAAWKPEHVYFTSNTPMEMWWDDLSHATRAAVLRRVTDDASGVYKG